MPTKTTKPEALDLTDHAAIRAWLADVEGRIEDMAGVAEDAAAPLAHRKLGRLEHHRLLGEARGSLAKLIAFARRGLAR